MVFCRLRFPSLFSSSFKKIMFRNFLNCIYIPNFIDFCIITLCNNILLKNSFIFHPDIIIFLLSRGMTQYIAIKTVIIISTSLSTAINVAMRSSIAIIITIISSIVINITMCSSITISIANEFEYFNKYFN